MENQIRSQGGEFCILGHFPQDTVAFTVHSYASLIKMKV